MKSTLLATLILSVSSGVIARMFTVYNACPFTVWPALYTDMNVEGNVRPDHRTGWEAAPYTSEIIFIPDNWKAGRIWARRDCDFTIDAPGPNSCLSGGCIGGLECDPGIGTGVPPATVAEWTLEGWGNLDNYDVSLVDGYNLPMTITNNQGCVEAHCEVDLIPDCPAPLKGPFDGTGWPIGCKSSCAANLDGNPENSPNCCSGQYDLPETCPKEKVQFYDYFKSKCPQAYAYAYDEKSGTALLTCPSSLRADYTLTFCPPPGLVLPDIL